MTKNWRDVPGVNSRYIKLNPKMLLSEGIAKKIKVPTNIPGKKGFTSVEEDVIFDKDFVVECLYRVISQLAPLRPEKVQDLLNEVMERYKNEV